MADANRFRLKQTLTDVWSVRERLALASSVSRSGDQNWVSVSRAVRPFGMPNRPADWFSQKNCALQYSELLENVETPRRKRNEREGVETPGDVIVRKLTTERIEELKMLIAKEAEEYKSLKRDLEAARSGQYDGQIKEMWETLQTDKEAASKAAAKAAAEEAAARERAKAAAMKSKKPFSLNCTKPVPGSDIEDNTQDSIAFDLLNNEDSNLSIVSSIPTPGPLQTIDNNLDIASPGGSAAENGSAVPCSPKLEVVQTSEELLPKEQEAIDTTLTAESCDTSVTKTEIKTEPMEDDVVKTEVEVKVEEQSVTEDVSQDTASSCVVDEVKADSPPSEKADAVLIENEVFDKELIPFIPAEASPIAGAPELVVEEETNEADLSIEVVTETPLEIPEERTEQMVPDVVEEIQASAQEIQEPEMDVMDVETDKNDDSQPVSFQPNLPQDSNDMETKADDQQMAVEEVEVQKAEELTISALGPSSPSSSIISTETGSVHSKRSHRRGRGRKPRRNRRRPIRARQQSEEGKESELSSKEGESSDEEVRRVPPPAPENEDSLLLSSLPQHLDPNESLPNSPASLSHSDTEDEKSHRVWKKSIMLVWRAATNHKCASVFLHPVTEDIAPGYHSIVHKPMDLQKIKRKIDNGEIRTTAEFQRDMMLMFTNAIMYNNSDHDVHKMAKNMYKDVMGHIEQFVSTQIMVQAEPKLLRTLRRTDAIHSDKEEDTKRKRTADSEQTPSTSGAKVKKRKL